MTTPISLTEWFNTYIQRIEDFTFTLPFFHVQIGFHNRTITFYRAVTFFFVMVMGVFWVTTGYQGTLHSGFRDFLNTETLPRGVGIHFGTLIFTAMSFIVTSIMLERVGITKLRNVLYAFILSTGFINGIFECGYALLYDIIHHGELWITAPFLYTNRLALYPTFRNWYWLVFGFIFLYLIKNHYTRTQRTGKLNKLLSLQWDNPFKHTKLILIGAILVGCWLVWILYPQHLYLHVRGQFFPQYIYGFREYETVPDTIPDDNIVTLLETDWKAVYVENLGVRIINEITKLVHFIFFTLLFIPKPHERVIHES